MIRVRRLLEHGRGHPILGPVLLIVLVLMLAVLFMHTGHDGAYAATEVGAMCLGIATFLGLILTERLWRYAPEPLTRTRGDRGPPRTLSRMAILRPTAVAAAPLTLPLRR